MRGVTALRTENLYTMALSIYGNVSAGAIAPSAGDTSTRRSASDASTRGSAGDTVQKAREELVCSICIETLREPRTLTCQHTFCTACLKELGARSPRARRRTHSGVPEVTIACPECRTNIILPENGIYGEFACTYTLYQERIATATVLCALATVTGNETKTPAS